MDMILYENEKINLLVEENEILPVAVFLKMILKAFYAGLEASKSAGELSAQYELGTFIAKQFMKEKEGFNDYIGLVEALKKEIEKIIIA